MVYSAPGIESLTTADLALLIGLPSVDLKGELAQIEATDGRGHTWTLQWDSG